MGRIKAAAFPREKSLRTFEFDANPHLDAAVIHTLATCDWRHGCHPADLRTF